jgi:hypothetical protein
MKENKKHSVLKVHDAHILKFLLIIHCFNFEITKSNIKQDYKFQVDYQVL